MATKKFSLQSGVLIIISIGLLYLLLSSFGILTNNFLGWDAAHTGRGWKVIELIFLAITSVYIFLLVTDRATWEKATGFVLLAGLSLAIAAGTGFKGTAGDIKQRITYLNADGTIKDKTVLFEYYSDFYHLDTDTALVSYINKYNELPGRNNYNSYIQKWLRGDKAGGIPPSTAPRANEEFQWAEGAYDLKFK